MIQTILAAAATRLALTGAAGLLLAGCGQDCFESKRMGDFEYSQGNYRNAIKHYLKALETDAACTGVKERLEEAKSREMGLTPAPAPAGSP